MMMHVSLVRASMIWSITSDLSSTCSPLAWHQPSVPLDTSSTGDRCVVKEVVHPRGIALQVFLVVLNGSVRLVSPPCDGVVVRFDPKAVQQEGQVDGPGASGWAPPSKRCEGLRAFHPLQAHLTADEAAVPVIALPNMREILLPNFGSFA
eukprot:348313-Hanusia_phi.AAC.3